MSSAGVRIEGITKRFDSLVAADRINQVIQPGEFFSLLGPSGCGKTTLLRIIAGFEQPDEGRIFIGEQDVTRQQPRNRPTAMVFQNYALFPNMTVGENVAYGLQVRKIKGPERTQRVKEALARVDLGGLEKKPVTQLSGGQQQRVALARALAVAPQVLLFDEPLSNLDVALREQTRSELKQLQSQLGTTSIYVTHDQQEALALSDRIAVMRAGRLVQVDAPITLYAEPQTAFVASFLGGSNIIASRALTAQLTGQSAPEGHVLAVRPEELSVAPPETSGAIPVKMLSRQFLGLYEEWWLEADQTTMRAWIAPGTALPESLWIFPKTYRWVSDDRSV